MIDLATRIVKSGTSTSAATASLTTGDLARHFCAALFSADRKQELSKTLATDWHTTVRITYISFLSSSDTVARSTLPDDYTTASSNIAVALAPARTSLSLTGLMKCTERAESSMWVIFSTQDYRPGRQTYPPLHYWERAGHFI